MDVWNREDLTQFGTDGLSLKFNVLFEIHYKPQIILQSLNIVEK